MNKKAFIHRILNDIELQRKAIALVENVVVGKVYEVIPWGDLKFLGRVTGFSYGAMSMGIRFQMMAEEEELTCLFKTVSLYNKSIKITPVEDVDLPKYVGWHVTTVFTNRLMKAKVS